MKPRIREKPCDRCAQLSAVMYRIQQDESATWCFVCPQCWKIVSHNNPFYTYGGTWKAKK